MRTVLHQQMQLGETDIAAIVIDAKSRDDTGTGSQAHYLQNGMQYCERTDYNRIIGYAQVGDQLNLHGFCNGTGAGNNIEAVVFTLNLCTTANPCP